MKHRSTKDTFQAISLALIVGLFAGTAATSCLVAAGAHSKLGLEFDHDNGHQHVQLGRMEIGDATGRPPRFWGLQVGSGDSLTTIGVYSDRPSAARQNIATHTTKLSPRLPE